VMDEMSRYAGTDLSFAEFLNNYQRKTKIVDIDEMATLYVEGFHAARADNISVQGLNKTNKAAEKIEDDKQFRIRDGYSLLMQALHDEAVAGGASFLLDTTVAEVRWRRNEVEVVTNGSARFKARQVLITLPLSLLPLSVGAYSYIPVGGNEAQAQLAQPVENTLFFAGEATNTEGHHGTVHGAIASGLRAAGEIMDSSA